jgi:hypothetical protein
MYVVRQAHHERKKVNKFNTPPFGLSPSASYAQESPVEGQLPGVLQVPLIIFFLTISIV